jgi:hypothetical protein
LPKLEKYGAGGPPGIFSVMQYFKEHEQVEAPMIGYQLDLFNFSFLFALRSNCVSNQHF